MLRWHPATVLGPSEPSPELRFWLRCWSGATAVREGWSEVRGSPLGLGVFHQRVVRGLAGAGVATVGVSWRSPGTEKLNTHGVVFSFPESSGFPLPWVYLLSIPVIRRETPFITYDALHPLAPNVLKFRDSEDGKQHRTKSVWREHFHHICWLLLRASSKPKPSWRCWAMLRCRRLCLGLALLLATSPLYFVPRRNEVPVTTSNGTSTVEMTVKAGVGAHGLGNHQVADLDAESWLVIWSSFEYFEWSPQIFVDSFGSFQRGRGLRKQWVKKQWAQLHLKQMWRPSAALSRFQVQPATQPPAPPRPVGQGGHDFGMKSLCTKQAKKVQVIQVAAKNHQPQIISFLVLYPEFCINLMWQAVAELSLWSRPATCSSSLFLVGVLPQLNLVELGAGDENVNMSVYICIEQISGREGYHLKLCGRKLMNMEIPWKSDASPMKSSIDPLGWSIPCRLHGSFLVVVWQREPLNDFSLGFFQWVDCLSSNFLLEI